MREACQLVCGNCSRESVFASKRDRQIEVEDFPFLVVLAIDNAVDCKSILAAQKDLLYKSNID